MTTWVIRAESKGESEQINWENNVISLGWYELPDLSNKSKAEIRVICEGVYPNADSSYIAARYWTFIREMQIGDFVVTPCLKAEFKQFLAVGEIVGEYEFKDIAEEVKHIRGVKWIKRLLRSSFTPDIQNYFNLRGTLYRLNPVAEQKVREMLEGGGPINNSYEHLLRELKTGLGYVEDETFRWDDVEAVLSLQLKKVDVKPGNKPDLSSHASNVTITEGRAPEPGHSKTDDFFPTFKLNQTFDNLWRLRVPVRFHEANLRRLEKEEPTGKEGWIDDGIQVRRRRDLNPEKGGSDGNPVIHICFEGDIDPLREKLYVDDYLVFTKRKNEPRYEAFGLRKDDPLAAKLGPGKQLLAPPKVKDLTTFQIVDLVKNSLDGIVDSFVADSDDAGLLIDRDYASRFIASLLAKPFVILTGLAGSGKTKLAEAFAKWLSVDDENYRIVAVGADWTSNENIVGYPDVLRHNAYVKTPTLDLLLNAANNPDVPHFLILDEMNLSHVERYFADFLSTMESGEQIFLHNPWDVKGQEDEKEQEAESGVVPSSTGIPGNLFVVGTVNVDETTYMFSPKVLDRANVIEFRAHQQDIEEYLASRRKVDTERLKFRGAPFAQVFVEQAGIDASLNGDLKNRLNVVLMLFWRTLSRFHSEFSFRTLNEITKFIFFDLRLNEDKEFNHSFDAQIIQKILPKIQGSRKKIEPVLCALAALCWNEPEWDGPLLKNKEYLEEQSFEWAQLSKPLSQENGNDQYRLEDAYYPLSYEKIIRMLEFLNKTGFVSFPEA